MSASVIGVFSGRSRAELEYCDLYGACVHTMELLEDCACAECTERRTVEHMLAMSLADDAQL